MGDDDDVIRLRTDGVEAAGEKRHGCRYLHCSHRSFVERHPRLLGWLRILSMGPLSQRANRMHARQSMSSDEGRIYVYLEAARS